MSRNYYEYKDYDYKDTRFKDFGKDDCVNCKPAGHPLPKPIIMSCGQGNGFTFADNGESISLTSPSQASRPKTLASVLIDTTCLCKPQVKVEFASNVHFVPFNRHGNADLKFEFELVRKCNDGTETSLNSWLFEITGEDDSFAQTFSFIYCECTTCPGCCEYFVRGVPMELDECSFCVTNCHISAFAQSSCD